MINFKFVRSQLKNIVIPLIIFFLILLVLIIPSLTDSYLAPSQTVIRYDTGASMSSHPGAGALLNYIYFGIPGFIVLFSFTIVIIHILVSKEIDKGYFGSWLTASMSRKTVISSKLFVLGSAILMLYGSSLVVQLIIFPIRFNDFNLQAFGQIILYNLAFILLALFWAAINWIIICGFNKASVSISIAVAISTVFVVFAVLVLVSNVAVDMKFLKYFKYLTITSFFNSPFSFGSLPELPDIDFSGTIVAENLGIKALDFAWQLPVMFVLAIPLFCLGNFCIIKKDLFL